MQNIRRFAATLSLVMISVSIAAAQQSKPSSATVSADRHRRRFDSRRALRCPH